jgi:LysR family transcriptional regulator (chromosome initiation inhibitor)
LVDDLIAKGTLIDLSPDTETSVDLYWQVNRVSANPLAPLTAAIKQAAAHVLK